MSDCLMCDGDHTTEEHELARLRAEVDRLTKERDEARSDHGAAVHALAQRDAAKDALIAAARSEAESLRAERDALKCCGETYCASCGSCGVGGCCPYYCERCKERHDDVEDAREVFPQRERDALRAALREARARLERLEREAQFRGVQVEDCEASLDADGWRSYQAKRSARALASSPGSEDAEGSAT